MSIDFIVGSPEFESLSRLVRIQILAYLSASDLVESCRDNPRAALIYCGITSDRTPRDVVDSEIVYEHWRHWLRRDFGVAYAANQCAAFSGVERRMVAESMQRAMQIVGGSNFELVRVFRHIYSDVYDAAFNPLPLPGYLFWSYQDGVALVSQENGDGGSIYLVSIIDLTQLRNLAENDDSDDSLEIPMLRIAVIGPNRRIVDVVVSGAHTGLYCILDQPMTPAIADVALRGTFVRLTDTTIVVAYLTAVGPAFGIYAKVYVDPFDLDLSYVIHRTGDDIVETFELDTSGLPSTIGTDDIFDTPIVAGEFTSISRATFDFLAVVSAPALFASNFTVRSDADGDVVSVRNPLLQTYRFAVTDEAAEQLPLESTTFIVPLYGVDESNNTVVYSMRIVIVATYSLHREISTIEFVNKVPRVAIRYQLNAAVAIRPARVRRGGVVNGEDYVQDVTDYVPRPQRTYPSFTIRLNLRTGLFQLLRDNVGRGMGSQLSYGSHQLLSVLSDTFEQLHVMPDDVRGLFYSDGERIPAQIFNAIQEQ